MTNGEPIEVPAQDEGRTGRAGTRPSLAHLFLAGVEAAHPKKRPSGGEYYELSAVAMVGAFVYSAAAILGTEKFRAGEALASMIWDPSRVDDLWRMGATSIESRDAQLPSLEGLGLWDYYLKTQFPQLFSKQAWEAATADAELMERVAGQQVEPDVAHGTWSAAVAEGLAFGITDPDRAREMLEVDYAPPDREWGMEARDAGLGIPPEPEYVSLEEQTDKILEATAAFVQDFYPELRNAVEGVGPQYPERP